MTQPSKSDAAESNAAEPLEESDAAGTTGVDGTEGSTLDDGRGDGHWLAQYAREHLSHAAVVVAFALYPLCYHLLTGVPALDIGVAIVDPGAFFDAFQIGRAHV